jgi:hypothetical protein
MSESVTTDKVTFSGVTAGGPVEFRLMLDDGRAEQRRAPWRAMTDEERRADWKEQQAERNRKVDEQACPVCARRLVEAGVPVRDYYGWKSVKATYCSNACRQKACRQRVTPGALNEHSRNAGADG